MRRGVLVVVAVTVLSSGVAMAAMRSDGSTPAPRSIARLVAHVPVSTLNRVGAGKLAGKQQFGVMRLSGAPLTSGGKPELFSEALAWCPHCASTSWGLAIALSRFGTLSHLRIIDSGTLFGTKYHGHPPFPHTKGISFFGARYRSAYLRFVEVVLQDRRGHNLQKPTTAENQAINAFDSGGIIPAIDVGGGWGLVGSAVSPRVLAGKSWSQIASSLADPRSAIAQRVDGLANLLTAAICQSTGGKPAAVCNSRGVVAAGAAGLR